MRNSLKGVIWSALIFPGSGQIVLGYGKRGALFAGFALCCAAALIMVISAGTWKGLEGMAERGEPIGPQALFSSAIAGLRRAETLVAPLLVLCWSSSVFDAWRLGRRKDDQMVNSQTSDQGV